MKRNIIMNQGNGTGRNNLQPGENGTQISDSVVMGISQQQQQELMREREHRFEESLRDDRVLLEQMVHQRQQGFRTNQVDVNPFQGMRHSCPTAQTPSQHLHKNSNSEEFVMPTFADRNVDQHNFFQPQGQSHQQIMTRSLPHIYGPSTSDGLIHNSSNIPHSQSMPQFQGNQSLEELRANVYQKTLQLMHLEQQVDTLPSPVFRPSPSPTESFQNQQPSLQQQQRTPQARSPFPRDDPLSFLSVDNVSEYGMNSNRGYHGNSGAINHLPPNIWEQQQSLKTDTVQMDTITNKSPNRESTRTPLPPSIAADSPPPSPDSSQMKRRRLNSDQMLHMFLADTIIESPGKKTLSPEVVSTAAVKVIHSGLPRPPFMCDDKSTAPNKEEESKQKIQNVTKTKQGAYDAAPKKKPEHIVTPTTATISELTAQIRSKAMMKQEQKKESTTTSSSDETQEASSDSNQDKPITKDATLAGLAKIASAMEASQSSQQNIHDWDKKFGLKRAHCKTMRESCRSRKKVLDFLQEELKKEKSSVLSIAECTTVHENSADVATDSVDALKAEDELSDQDNASSTSVHDNENVEMTAKEQIKEEDVGDDDDVLERLFRRASLDCMESLITSPLLRRGRETSTASSFSSSSSSKSSNSDTRKQLMPSPQDTDKVQYNARCA